MILSPVGELVRSVYSEAVSTLSSRAYDAGQRDFVVSTEAIREWFRDHWYRFAKYGVASRADFDNLKVTETPETYANELWGDSTGLRTTINFTGTPLEGKLQELRPVIW